MKRVWPFLASLRLTYNSDRSWLEDNIHVLNRITTDIIIIVSDVHSSAHQPVDASLTRDLAVTALCHGLRREGLHLMVMLIQIGEEPPRPYKKILTQWHRENVERELCTPGGTEAPGLTDTTTCHRYRAGLLRSAPISYRLSRFAKARER